MSVSRHLRVSAPRALCAGLFVLLTACEPAPDEGDGSAASPSSEPAAAEQVASAGGPPAGRYVCRQYTTTMGYLTLEEGGEYEVSGVRGRYRYDDATGAMEWEGGSYDEWDWDGVYEHVDRPADDGRPDEDIVRLTSEADGLKIDCYKMAEEG